MQKTRIVEKLNHELPTLKVEDRIKLISKSFSKPIFTTSLGLEDQVLTWAIASYGRSIDIATLQTGRLFAETVSLIGLTKEHFGIPIKEYTPDDNAVSNYISQHGKNGYYDSVEARKQCCHIRKVIPLGRALQGSDAWITGLRQEQSSNRQSIPMAEWDSSHNLIKLNPLADWTTKDIQSAIAAHKIPVNPLHSCNYPSIGCEPCTRAIKPGEPERAGRWWWEQGQQQECGLHVREAPVSSPEIEIGKHHNV